MSKKIKFYSALFIPSFKNFGEDVSKEVQIVYRLILVSYYLLHVSRLTSQLASSGIG